MNKCPGCNREFTAGEVICRVCGTSVEETIKSRQRSTTRFDVERPVYSVFNFFGAVFKFDVFKATFFVFLRLFVANFVLGFSLLVFGQRGIINVCLTHGPTVQAMEIIYATYSIQEIIFSLLAVVITIFALYGFVHVPGLNLCAQKYHHHETDLKVFGVLNTGRAIIIFSVVFGVVIGGGVGAACGAISSAAAIPEFLIPTLKAFILYSSYALFLFLYNPFLFSLCHAHGGLSAYNPWRLLRITLTTFIGNVILLPGWIAIVWGYFLCVMLTTKWFMEFLSTPSLGGAFKMLFMSWGVYCIFIFVQTAYLKLVGMLGSNYYNRIDKICS